MTRVMVDNYSSYSVLKLSFCKPNDLDKPRKHIFEVLSEYPYFDVYKINKGFSEQYYWNE